LKVALIVGESHEASVAAVFAFLMDKAFAQITTGEITIDHLLNMGSQSLYCREKYLS
jgi:hypothetical protein